MAESYRERVFRSYQDSMAPELEMKAGIEDPEFHYDSYRSLFLPHLPQDRGARIVDVGCGTGNFLGFLKAQGYAAASGVDRSPQMVKIARSKGLEVAHGDAVEHLAGLSGKLDAVVALDVLEHLHKDELFALLDASLAALRPGGWLLVHTVNADGPFWGRMRYIDITHEQAYTRYSLSQCFKVCGFSRSEFHATHPVGSGLTGLRRRAISALFRLAAGLYYHAETGSGIRRNDHLVTATLIAKAVK